jgi:hypothetical protein
MIALRAFGIAADHDSFGLHTPVRGFGQFQNHAHLGHHGDRLVGAA